MFYRIAALGYTAFWVATATLLVREAEPVEIRHPACALGAAAEVEQGETVARPREAQAHVERVADGTEAAPDVASVSIPVCGAGVTASAAIVSAVIRSSEIIGVLLFSIK